MHTTTEFKEDLRQLVKQVLRVSTRNVAEAVLVLAVLAGSITREEIFVALGHQLTAFSSKIKSQLTKTGDARSVQLSRPDGPCEKALIPTEKGIDKAKAMIRRTQVISLPMWTSGDYDINRHALAYNLFEFLRMGVPIKWMIRELERDEEKAEDFEQKDKTPQEGAVVEYDDGQRIFIQEITDIEKMYSIDSEIMKYDKPRKFWQKPQPEECFSRAGDILVFSTRTYPEAEWNKRGQINIYSKREIKRLMACMNEVGARDARCFLGRSDLYSNQEFVYKLISRIDLESPGVEVTVGFLADLISEIEHGACSLRFADANRFHFNEAVTAIQRSAQMLCQASDRGDEVAQRTIVELLSGRTVAIIPTSLLSERLPLLLDNEFPVLKRGIEDFLRRKLNEREYEESPGVIRIGNGRFKPHYNYVTDSHLSVGIDFPTVDTGAFLRIKMILDDKVETNNKETPYLLYYIFREKDEIERFLRLIGVDPSQNAWKDYLIEKGYFRLRFQTIDCLCGNQETESY